MASEVDQASQNLQEEESELQNDRQGMGGGTRTKIEQLIPNLKQLKSLEILKSALTIFTTNIKFMLFMILSIIPYFAFMVFFEIKLHKTINALPYILSNRFTIKAVMLLEVESSQHVEISDVSNNYHDDDDNMKEKDLYTAVVQICVFYLVLYPVLEIISMVITVKIAAKAHAGERKATLKEVLYYRNNSLKDLSTVCLCVHLLSLLTFLGGFWIAANHYILTRDSFLALYNNFYRPTEDPLFILSLTFHSVIVIALLYKYLQWSAFWNMSMVISILGEEAGSGAFGIADYYGKHCKQTGFQLMLVFFIFGNVLRLPCLFAGLYNSSTVCGVFLTSIAIVMVCLGNLVKWIAFVLYYNDCKQQTLEKKADEEVGKAKNAGDAS